MPAFAAAGTARGALAAPTNGSASAEAVGAGALRAGERKMLDELVALYPHALTREKLGDRAGYTASGGTFGAYVSTLRRNGLVAVDGDEVRASETLFLSSAPL